MKRTTSQWSPLVAPAFAMLLVASGFTMIFPTGPPTGSPVKSPGASISGASSSYSGSYNYASFTQTGGQFIDNNTSGSPDYWNFVAQANADIQITVTSNVAPTDPTQYTSNLTMTITAGSYANATYTHSTTMSGISGSLQVSDSLNIAGFSYVEVRISSWADCGTLNGNYFCEGGFPGEPTPSDFLLTYSVMPTVTMSSPSASASVSIPGEVYFTGTALGVTQCGPSAMNWNITKDGTPLDLSDPNTFPQLAGVTEGCSGTGGATESFSGYLNFSDSDIDYTQLAGVYNFTAHALGSSVAPYYSLVSTDAGHLLLGQAAFSFDAVAGANNVTPSGNSMSIPRNRTLPRSS